jgi:predicted DNA binding CopG/RHH family protein
MRKFPRTMSVRLTEQEFEEVKRGAKTQGLNVNGYIRLKLFSQQAES